MKKTGMLIALFAFAFVITAVTAYADDIDVIVMVDITWSLQENFDEIEQYLLGTMLEEVLHDGDVFHLLWFSEASHSMIGGAVLTRENRQSIREQLAGLVNLQFPMGKYTDLVGAIDYLIGYADDLSLDHKKLIILISDGIHDPRPGSDSSPDSEAIQKRFLEQAEELKKNGWSIHLLRTTDAAGTDNQGADDFFRIFTDNGAATVTQFDKTDQDSILTATTGFAEIVFPAKLGVVSRECIIPFMVKNAGTEQLTLNLSGIMMDETDILMTPAAIDVPAGGAVDFPVQALLPQGLSAGEQTVTLHLVFADDIRVVGETGTLSFIYDETAPPQMLHSFPVWLILLGSGGIALLALLFFLLLHFLKTRGFKLSVRRTISADAIGTRQRLHSTNADSHHSFAIEMIVTYQKRHIGQRNIRRLYIKRPASIGGGNSAFLIFLVHVPRRIAEIIYDGSTFSFKPIKSDYFPEVRGPITDCLDKPISAVSRKGFPLEISFHRYVSPLDEINRIFDKIRETAH